MKDDHSKTNIGKITASKKIAQESPRVTRFQAPRSITRGRHPIVQSPLGRLLRGDPKCVDRLGKNGKRPKTATDSPSAPGLFVGRAGFNHDPLGIDIVHHLVLHHGLFYFLFDQVPQVIFVFQELRIALDG